MMKGISQEHRKCVCVTFHLFHIAINSVTLIPRLRQFLFKRPVILPHHMLHPRGRHFQMGVLGGGAETE